MPSVPVERFMAEVMDDEGWMASLSADAIGKAIAGLEAALPEGSALAPARAEKLRAALRRLGALAGALKAGTLDDQQLVEGCLAFLEG